MSIRLPDPFILDGAPGFIEGSLTSNHPYIGDELSDGRVLQIKNGTQYWSINITYPDLLPTEYSIIISSIEEAKRLNTYIDILLPQYTPFRVRGNLSNTVVTTGQKGSTLTITNISGMVGRPLAGDLVQLTGASKKVYRITKVDTSVVGTLTLGVYPDLVTQTLGTEKPEFNNILFQTKLTDWNTVSNLSIDGLYTAVAFKFREAK